MANGAEVVAELAAKIGLQFDPREFDNFFQTITKANNILLGFGAAAVAGAGLLGLTVFKVAEAADEVGDTAERIGIGTSALQELRHAAIMADVPVDVMQQGLKFIARNAYEASTAGGAAADSFAKIGVSVKRSDGSLKSADELLGDVAKGFEGVKDSSAKTGIAMELFGRAGQGMVPLLNRGAAGVAELRKQAEELGFVLGDKAIADAQKWDDSMKIFRASLGGLIKGFASPFIPKFTKFIEQLTRIINDNRPRMASLVDTVMKLADGFLAASEAVVKFLSNKDYIDFLVTSLKVAAAAFIVLKAEAVASAIAAGASWLLAVAPIVLAAAALSLVFDELSALGENKEGYFKDFLKWLNEVSSSPLWEMLKAQLAVVFDFMSPAAWRRAADSIIAFIAYLLDKVGIKLGDGIKKSLGSTLEDYVLPFFNPAVGVGKALEKMGIGGKNQDVFTGPSAQAAMDLEAKGLPSSNNASISIHLHGSDEEHLQKVRAVVSEELDKHHSAALPATGAY